MMIGYMRVSTADQSLDLQHDALLKAGVMADRIYQHVCSGRETERPGLDRALDVARDGDALVVWRRDRIGRSLPHVVGLVGNLQKRGVGLKLLTGDVDTTTATGRLVFGIFAAQAAFKRGLLHERTMAGLAAARARGRASGRPRVMTRQKLKVAMTMMADRDNAARDVARKPGVSVSTLYACVDGNGQRASGRIACLQQGGQMRVATMSNTRDLNTAAVKPGVADRASGAGPSLLHADAAGAFYTTPAARSPRPLQSPAR